MEITSIMGLSWAGKLAAASVALVLLFGLLRYLDRRAGIDFPEFAKDMRNDPKAAGLYLGLRYLGSCLLIGLVLAFS